MDLPLTEAGKPYRYPDTVADMTTDSEHPWYCDADGILCSGNKNQKSTTSVLRVSVKGSGALVFDFRVSSEKQNSSSTQDSFVFWKEATADDFELIRSFSYRDLEKYGMKRYFGEQDWTSFSIPVEADEKENTSIFFIYKKNGSKDIGEDRAYLRNVRFVSGKTTITAKANDASLGHVDGETEYYAGDNAVLTAVPDEGCKFYGWSCGGKMVSSDAEYSFVVGNDAELIAVFGKEDLTTTQNMTTGFVYSSPADALKNAASGDVVMLIADGVLSEPAAIPDGVTFYVPYSSVCDPDGYADGTLKNSSVLATAEDTYCRLTITENACLNVEGRLLVGGEIGYPSQAYQGHTSGKHGRIVNNGLITVAEKGVLDCYGFVEGSGEVQAKPGAEIYEPFIVYDFAGGSNTVDLVNASMAPFVQYTMQNINCALVIDSGAFLYGHCNLYTASTGEFNKTDALVVGGSRAGLLMLKDGATLKRTVNAGSFGSTYCPDLHGIVYEIDGGAVFSYLSMEIMGVSVSTQGILFPIPYGISYVLKNGDFEIGTDTVLYPGASMTVAKDAALTVHERFYVLNGLKQNSLSGKYYPSTELLKQLGLSTGADLLVNGSLVLDAGVPFGGIVQTGRKGARIIAKETPNAEADPYHNTVTLGAKTSYGDNTTVMTLDGRVNVGGTLTKLEQGNTYTSVDAKTWSLPYYTVDSYAYGSSSDPADYKGSEQIRVDADMSGSFVNDASQEPVGDINDDGTVDEKDLDLLAGYLAGLNELSESQKQTADGNDDGRLDSRDLTVMCRILSD